MAIRTSASRSRFQGSARSSGFKPIDVGGQNIQRMREESARVVEGMRAARNAEIQDRQRQSAAMRDNATAERNQLKQNQSIAEGNANRELQGLKLKAQSDAEAFERQQQETAAIFGSIAELSATAGKKARELEQQRADEEAQQAYNNYDPNSDAVLQQIFGEGELAAMSEQREQGLDEAEAAGYDPLSVKQARAMNSYQQVGVKAARANYLLTEVYEQKLAAAYKEDPSLEIDRAGTAAFAATFKRNFLKQTGLLGYKPEMVRNGLAQVQRVNQSYVNRADKAEQSFTDSMIEDKANTMLTNNPQEFSSNILSSFRSVARVKGDYGKALDWYEGLATARNAKGEFIFSLDQLASADLKGSGKGFKDEWAGRYGKMVQARASADAQYRNQQLQVERIGYKEDVARVLAGLREDPSQANAEAAVQFFRETRGRVPPEILKFQEAYTTEALDKVEQIKRFNEIPPGFITPEDVDALNAIDPQAGQKLAAKFKEQEARYNSGVYKKNVDSFKTLANGVTSFGSNKPNTPSSIFLQSKIQGEYRKRVDEAVAGGADFQTAATQIGLQLEQEVKAGFIDPNSQWYRKVNAPGGTSEFPNLNNEANKSSIQKAKDRYDALKAKIASQGVQKTVEEPESIITGAEAQELVKNYGKPGFEIPTDVLAVAGMTNGADPFVIINKQLAALGLPELPAPPSIQAVQKASPEFQKLLYKTQSAERSTRGMGGASNGEFKPELVKNGYGGMVLDSAGRHGVQPNYIAALMEIESGFNASAVSRTGAVGLMQIQQDQHPAYKGGSNPQENIDYGTQYYGQMLKLFGDPVTAAGAYNAGPGRMQEHLDTGRPLPAETVSHMKKFAAAMYKYGGGTQALRNPNVQRGNTNKLVASTESFIGMDTSAGPDKGNNACVWALNKVMRAAGMEIPWGESVYVPYVKGVLDKKGRRVEGPVPGAIAIMQDNGNPPYPHIGIVDANGMIVSNSSSRAKFDWRGTPQEYEQQYGRPNLYYMMN